MPLMVMFAFIERPVVEDGVFWRMHVYCTLSVCKRVSQPIFGEDKMQVFYYYYRHCVFFDDQECRDKLLNFRVHCFQFT